MLLITAAHLEEAKSLIKLLELDKTEISGFQAYQGQGITLIITGMGNTKAQSAVNQVLTALKSEIELHATLNIGICGARTEIAPGTIAQACSVFSHSSQRFYYPDLILDLKLPLYSLESREKPYIQGKSDPLSCDLVDMESAGFFEAAQKYISPSSIFILKMVSDHGQSFAELKDSLPQLINSSSSILHQKIILIQEWLNAQQNFSANQQQLIQTIIARLKLTETQKQKILFLCRARHKNSLLENILEPFMSITPKTSDERRNIFEELSHALALPLI